jgi:glycosyltransferase involved in cell wall biosynthesis
MVMRLVVIPSDPIEAYEKQGLYFLKEYYNPQGFFDEVYAISPWETMDRIAYGMNILKIPEKNFKKTIKKIKPDVIRAYGGYWASDLACYNKVKKIPIVVSVHDTNKDLLFSSVRNADMVICMSQIVANIVEDFGVQKNRIRILPNRIDINVFSPKNDSLYFKKLNEMFPAGRHILHIGRKTEQKNIDTLIKSLPLLPTEYSAIFIGAGDAANYIKLAADYNVADRCFWIEYVNNAELPFWYSWCDCFCTPSRWEGFGFVFIEAAACGAAIITSDIAPMNEYLTHNKDSFLVKEFEDPKKLAAAICYVCEDIDYKKAISSKAIETGKLFERDKIDAIEVSYYKEILSSRNK